MRATAPLMPSPENGKARSPALAVEALSKRFADLTAIEDVSFSVKKGEFVALIGPSGCGKSTLFNIIGGLLGDYSGRVLVDGEAISGAHHAIGMVFQEESTFPWRTTLDNIAFPLEISGVKKAEREARARDLVKLVGLQGFEARYPAELSGGMRQRTALARTLAFQPKILLMDEPFAALDEISRDALNEDLLQLWREDRLTIVFVTHSVYESTFLSTRIVTMTPRPGRIANEIVQIGRAHV